MSTGSSAKVWLWAGLATAAAMGGLGFWLIRRKKKEKSQSDQLSPQGSVSSAGFTASAPTRRSAPSIELIDPNEADALNPKYFGYAENWAKHNDRRPIQKLHDIRAANVAKQIQSAWGGAWYKDDDEDKIYQAFRSLDTKADVARVALEYSRFGSSLKQALQSQLSDDEYKKVQQIINQKPNYKLK